MNKQQKQWEGESLPIALYYKAIDGFAAGIIDTSIHCTNRVIYIKKAGGIIGSDVEYNIIRFSRRTQT